MAKPVYEWRIGAFNENGKWTVKVIDDQGKAVGKKKGDPNKKKKPVQTKKVGPKLANLVHQEYLAVSITDSDSSGWIHCGCIWFPG